MSDTLHKTAVAPRRTPQFLADLWDDDHAAALESQPLELLRYRSNLLGADLRITNFGGGNTSSKFTRIDPLTGQPQQVMAVKGSGGDFRFETGVGFLTGAVAAWSLTWIGSLLQTASLQGSGTIGGLSLEIGFWLQAASIGVVVIGTILVATRRTGAHEHGAPGIESRDGTSIGREDDGSTA